VVERIGQWMGDTFPEGDLTVQFDKLREETDEAIYEFDNGGTIEHKARECMDVAFVAFGIVGLLGYDPQEMLETLVEKNYAKYPPEVIATLTEGGLTLPEALGYCKSQWIGDDEYYDGGEVAIQFPLPHISDTERQLPLDMEV